MILDLIIAAAFLCSMLHIRLLKEVRYLGIPFILKWDGRQFIPTNQQRVAAIHSKKHTPKLIAGKSIAVYVPSQIDSYLLLLLYLFAGSINWLNLLH